jgi:hypothetical protein
MAIDFSKVLEAANLAEEIETAKILQDAIAQKEVSIVGNDIEAVKKLEPSEREPGSEG